LSNDGDQKGQSRAKEGKWVWREKTSGSKRRRKREDRDADYICPPIP